MENGCTRQVNVCLWLHLPPCSGWLRGTVAHKIMQKYGFKEGQGLGKHEQGLSTALSVEKTSKRGGKIIIGDAAEKRKSSGAAAFSPAGSAFRLASAVSGVIGLAPALAWSRLVFPLAGVLP